MIGSERSCVKSVAPLRAARGTVAAWPSLISPSLPLTALTQVSSPGSTALLDRHANVECRQQLGRHPAPRELQDVAFQRVDDYRPPDWPGQGVPQQMHLDVDVDDLDEGEAAANEFADVVKAGRTHLMDASPITLGQEFGGYAAQIAEARQRLAETCVRVAAVPLGGTATGNGLNAPAQVAELAIADIARFASQASPDALVELSGQLRVTATGMFKIANDIRLLASGPPTGLAEIRIPELQPGSSIMPGKVNPVLCEVVTQVAAQVIGHDATIGFAGSQGTLEMNTYLPVIAENLLASISLLGRAAADFGTRCVLGIEADRDRCRTFAEASPAVAAALNPLIGYGAATRLVRGAHAERRSLREVVTASGLLDEAQIEAVMDVDALARVTETESRR